MYDAILVDASTKKVELEAVVKAPDQANTVESKGK